MLSPVDFPPNASATRRRFLIAAGTSDYENIPDARLPSVEQDLQRIRELFCNTLHYKNALPDLKINPKSDEFRNGLRDWIRKGKPNQSDVLVIFYSGHGNVELNKHYLLTTESDPNDLLDTAIPTEYLAQRIARSSLQVVLILIDACYAGQGSDDITKVVSGIKDRFSRENSGYFVIAAARPKEEAREGVFSEALADVLSDERLGGVQQEFLWPSAVSRAINQYFCDRELHQRAMFYEASVAVEDPPFFPNPRYRPTVPAGVDLKTQRWLSSMAPADVVLHWAPRARGVELDSQTGWYFTGRTRILRELVAWLKTPAVDARPQVITGAPGVGKSAVLARLATTADPRFRPWARLADLDPGTIPPPRCIDVAIHAKGKTTTEIVRVISTIAGNATDDPDNLIRNLADRTQPLTIVIDALDEAKEPEAIADKILQPITRLPTVRLLIGTRKGLIPRLGTDVEIKYLDGEYNDPADIRDYVRVRLLARDEPEVETPYRNRSDLADSVAEAVAAKAKTVFLLARLICENLINAKEPADPESVNWRDELPATVSAAFGEYLRRFGADEQRVRDVLLPLAYAEGEGLPWDTLWAPVASALSGHDYTDEDVAWVRDKAGAYIIEALQSGQSVYRLYHQALADYFHDDKLNQTRQGQMARALIASVPEREAGRTWQEANSYVLQHLSTHAAKAGTLPELVRDPLYLVTADPVGLLPAINSVISGLPGEIVRVYKHIVHRLHNIPLAERAAYLELSARKQRVNGMAEAIAKLPFYREWLPKWTIWAPSQAHTVFLGGHSECVNSVALQRLGSREIIVSLTDDNTVRVWDASTGKELYVLEGRWRGANSVALGQLCGWEVISSDGLDVSLRDAATGNEVQVFKRPLRDSNSVALGQLWGWDVTIFGGCDMRVRDAATGKTVQDFKGHSKRDSEDVCSIAFGQHEGRQVIVSGCEDGAVRLWDASTGRRLRVLKGHSGYVVAVLLGHVGGGDVIVSASRDETVRIWDASTGTRLRVLKGHSEAVNSVALGQLCGRDVIVSGSDDTTVRVWDASTGRRLQVLEGHSEAVNSVALGQLCGRDVIVSGSDDTTVRVWDAPAGGELKVLEGPSGCVNSITFGRVGGRQVIISGGHDATVRIWDADTGKELHVLKGHSDYVRSVAFGRLGNREIIISGSEDTTVRIWDADTGRRLRVLKNNSIGECCVAFGQLGGREIIVTGGFGNPVTVLDAATGKKLLTLGHDSHYAYSIALGQVGKRAVIICGKTDCMIGIWDTATGRKLQDIRGHSVSLHSVALGKLGGRKVIVSGSGDATVRVWDASTGKKLRVLKGHAEDVLAVAVGQLYGQDVIVSGGLDGTIRVWGFRPAKPLASIFLEAPVRSVALNDTHIAGGTTAGIAVLEITERQSTKRHVTS